MAEAAIICIGAMLTVLAGGTTRALVEAIQPPKHATMKAPTAIKPNLRMRSSRPFQIEPRVRLRTREEPTGIVLPRM